MILPLAGLIDHEAENARIRKSIGDNEKQAAGLRHKLANEQFTSRAPAEVVAGLRVKLAELDAQRATLEGLLRG